MVGNKNHPWCQCSMCCLLMPTLPLSLSTGTANGSPNQGCEASRGSGMDDSAFRSTDPNLRRAVGTRRHP